MRAGKEGVGLTMIEGGFAGLRCSGSSIRTAFVSFVRHLVNRIGYFGPIVLTGITLSNV